jgi:hypothetical protein
MPHQQQQALALLSVEQPVAGCKLRSQNDSVDSTAAAAGGGGTTTKITGGGFGLHAEMLLIVATTVVPQPTVGFGVCRGI